MTYKAKFHVHGAKQHVCANCQGKYSYQFRRTVEIEAGSELDAERKAEKKSNHALETGVEVHPCPHCGLVQPDMIGKVKRGRYRWPWLMGPLVLIIMFLAYESAPREGATYAAIVCGIVFLTYVWGVFYHPNDDLEGNRERAQQEVEDMKLSQDDPGSDTHQAEHHADRILPILDIVALFLAFLAILAAFSPAIFSNVSLWQTNSSDVVPSIVLPGQTVTIYFQEDIHSVKGYWRGKATLAVTNAKEIGDGAQDFQVATRNDRWPDVMQVKGILNEMNRMMVKVKVPLNGNLQNKTVRLLLTVDAEFPHAMNDQLFQLGQKNYRRTIDVYISNGKAYQTSQRAWWWGVGSALILVFVSGVMLNASTHFVAKNSGGSSQAVLVGTENAL